MGKNIEIGKKKNWFGHLHSKISGLVKKDAAQTPTLRRIQNVKSTPLLRSAAKIKQRAIYKRKRSSIGLSALSKSRFSTPKSSKKAKLDHSVPIKPLMPNILKKNGKNSTAESETIVLEETDEGIIVDASTKSSVPDSSPDIEILTVKITPKGSKNVKASKKVKKRNPQKIFSKFNLPNPVFPKDTDYIPLNDEQPKAKRRPEKSKGYKFDPNAKPKTNFTPLVDQMAGQVYHFEGPSTSKQSCGSQRRRPTMGLCQLQANSRSKLHKTASKPDVIIDYCSGSKVFDNVQVGKFKSPAKRGSLRAIVIDGQNVAVEHAKANGGLVISNKNSYGGGAAPRFSCDGIRICVDYFRQRGHQEIFAFVPQFRQKRSQSNNPEILDELNRQGILKFTPCKQIDGKAYNSYDDRFIVQSAAMLNAVIISNDNYRDLALEDDKLKDVIDNHILKFVWLNNTLMFAQDPLGKNGPTLEQFLRH